MTMTSGDISTDLATKRTLMAADRTLMAWLRTALSLYSFGFTIYKILEDFAKISDHTIRAHEPRTVGLIMTGMGASSMVMGCAEYWVRVRGLNKGEMLPAARPVFLMSVLMAAIGVFLFGGILTKLL